MKVGDIVKYVPSPSATFKWEQYSDTLKACPGIILAQVDTVGTHTRRFKVRWTDGKITEEWISYLEILE